MWLAVESIERHFPGPVNDDPNGSGRLRVLDCMLGEVKEREGDARNIVIMPIIAD